MWGSGESRISPKLGGGGEKRKSTFGQFPQKMNHIENWALNQQLIVNKTPLLQNITLVFISFSKYLKKVQNWDPMRQVLWIFQLLTNTKPNSIETSYSTQKSQ